MNFPATSLCSTTPLSPASSPLEVEIHRIRELSGERRYGEALTAATVLRQAFPRNRDVSYQMAVNQRYLERIPEALASLEALEEHHPRFSLLYQERGHCYLVLRDARRAVESFLAAVKINPALVTSWRMLESLYRESGDSINAATATAQLATLSSLPTEVVQAGSLFSDGELAESETILRAFLRDAGSHVEALRLLARIDHQRDRLDEAEELLLAVLRQAPDYRAARLDYVLVLIGRQKYSRAREEIDTLLSLEPGNREFLSLKATATAGLGDHETAVTLYREILAGAPGWAHVHVLLGHSLKASGRREEAILSYQAALRARPGFGDAYWSLANLKRYRYSEEEIASMRAAEGAGTCRPADRVHLCFALGKALEDRGRYGDSWSFYERGNALVAAQSRYRPETTETNTRRQIEVCTAKFFASRSGGGAPDADPIFIVGLPRSGSTLIEQILASHSQVQGTQELYDIQRIALELHGSAPDLRNPRYPGILADLPPEEFRRLGERYLADTRAYRDSRPYFIDKMPNNFRHIGLMHLMLPNAKIIDMRREPMACCFSNLKQLYASGQGFSYSMEFIARYYRTYLDLMRHWDEVLPGRVLHMRYEDVVADLEGSVRRLLEFCGLDFQPACLAFHDTPRSVSTASSEQVRQPIYREGLSQWRHYEPWLGPLKDALGDALL